LSPLAAALGQRAARVLPPVVTKRPQRVPAGEPDRVILGADLAVAVLVDQELVAAEPVVPGSLAGVDERRWAHICPVQIRGALEERERIGALARFGLELVRKVRGVHQAQARRDLEAAGAADDHQALDAGSTQTIGHGARHVMQRVIDTAGRDGAYDGVRAGDRGGHGGWVGDVSAGGAAHADDLVAALLELGRDPTADHACGSDDDDLHVFSWDDLTEAYGR
jgi:hypothetical protein